MNEEAPQCKRTRIQEENENEKNNTINEDPIYMDCNATTPLAPSVITTISEALHTGWANPSSSYKAGVEAKRIVTKARQQLLTLVNGRHLSEMTFMSGGTEANNHVIWLAVKYYYKFYSHLHSGETEVGLQDTGLLPHIITSTIEHDSILKPLKRLQEEGITFLFFIISLSKIKDSELVVLLLQPHFQIFS